MNKTRDELLAESQACLAERRRLEAKVDEVTSRNRNINPADLRRWKDLIERLKRREHELAREAGKLGRKKDDPDTGRLFVHLCRAIKAEFGAGTLTSLVMKARESIEAEEALKAAGVDVFLEPEGNAA